MIGKSSFVRRATCVWCILGAASQAFATWSICLTNTETKEVAVGTVTCLTNFDLLAIVPVIVVEKGSGAAQAAGDFPGTRRPIIFNGLVNGDEPADILAALAAFDPAGHEARQYGIADVLGRTATFSGANNFQWAGGVTGNDGPLTYAIQGNILAGSCIVPAIEQAVRNTSGDLAEKLMAGMEAAQMTGGDGRCSCDDMMPESCGCPPAAFTKSGHIGGMVVARKGNTDDPSCGAGGCADGTYYMRLNVPNQAVGNPDPVTQLRAQYDAFRNALIGRPDAIASVANVVESGGRGVTTLEVALKDWQGLPITIPLFAFQVNHAPGSAGLTGIGATTDLGGGQYSVALTPGEGVGTDIFRVEAFWFEGPQFKTISLMPDPQLVYTGQSPALQNYGALVLGLSLTGVGALLVCRNRRLLMP